MGIEKGIKPHAGFSTPENSTRAGLESGACPTSMSVGVDHPQIPAVHLQRIVTWQKLDRPLPILVHGSQQEHVRVPRGSRLTEARSAQGLAGFGPQRRIPGFESSEPTLPDGGLE